MNSLLNDHDEEVDRDDRELTLSTGMILAIFFGLVLLCGLVFGLGYKMGAHKPIPADPNAVASSSTPSTDFGGFKPAPGSPAGSTPSVPVPKTVTPIAAPATSASGEARALAPPAAPIVRSDPTTGSRSAPDAGSAGPASAAGFIVQVAAVSHQEDAELLVNALRAKGYPVSAHVEAQDKFFHIQVGPFTNRRDAEAAKQRLVGDGYQPIVK